MVFVTVLFLLAPHLQPFSAAIPTLRRLFR
jgi:hypothetical protein